MQLFLLLFVASFVCGFPSNRDSSKASTVTVTVNALSTIVSTETVNALPLELRVMVLDKLNVADIKNLHSSSKLFNNMVNFARKRQTIVIPPLNINHEIHQSLKQINNENFVELQKQTQHQNGPIAFLNRPGASYGDAVIFTEPPFVLQEKQSILSRNNILEGKKPNLIGASVFNIERAKINNKEALFVMITDERERIETQMSLGGRDILICWDEPGTETLYAKFAGNFVTP